MFNSSDFEYLKGLVFWEETKSYFCCEEYNGANPVSDQRTGREHSVIGIICVSHINNNIIICVSHIKTGCKHWPRISSQCPGAEQRRRGGVTRSRCHQDDNWIKVNCLKSHSGKLEK